MEQHEWGEPERTLRAVDEREFRDLLERTGSAGVTEAADGTGELIIGACFSELRSRGKYYLVERKLTGLKKEVRFG